MEGRVKVLDSNSPFRRCYSFRRSDSVGVRRLICHVRLSILVMTTLLAVVQAIKDCGPLCYLWDGGYTPPARSTTTFCVPFRLLPRSPKDRLRLHVKKIISITSPRLRLHIKKIISMNSSSTTTVLAFSRSNARRAPLRLRRLRWYDRILHGKRSSRTVSRTKYSSASFVAL